MADIGGSSSQFLVSPNHEIEMKWVEVQIQERKSRIARHKQDIEDLQKGKIVDLEAKIMMLVKELKHLENKLNNITPTDVNVE